MTRSIRTSGNDIDQMEEAINKKAGKNAAECVLKPFWRLEFYRFFRLYAL
jgi:hypothetical protein